MGAHSRLCAFSLAALLFLPGCALLSRSQSREEAAFERNLDALSVPLDLQDYRVVSADGQRGVFLKLSRLPDAVEGRTENDPPRVVLDISGPTGAEAPEEEFPGGDTLISRVRVARRFGLLRVTLELQGDTVPTYSVHRMADWIMVRITP